MARPGVTYEQVAAVADAMIGEGKEPGIQSIRDRIIAAGGSGSPNTIHRHLTAWKAARPQAAATVAELPATLTAAIALEIEKAAVSARAEVEGKLVQSQVEAAELSTFGESLETERDELLEQVIELTTERDNLAGKADQLAADIKDQGERIEREQQAAEAARVELAKVQLKIESSTEKLGEQSIEIERLRLTLDLESKARIVAEQEAAVLSAKLESMSDRATKAETRTEQIEKQNRQSAHELNSARNQVQAQQIALDAADREIDDVRKQIKEVRNEAKKASEEAAELRGKLAVSIKNPVKKPVKNAVKISAATEESNS